MIKKNMKPCLIKYFNCLCLFPLPRFQPTREEQQHGQPPGAGRCSRVRPRICRPFPHGSAERRSSAWQTATPLQHGGARLLTGGGSLHKQGSKSHMGAAASSSSTHCFHASHGAQLRRYPPLSHPQKFSVSF